MACSLPDLSLLLDKDNRDNKKPHRQDEEPPDSCGTREEPMDTHSHPGVINLHASHASIANPSLLATFKDKLLEFDEVDHSMDLDFVSEDDDIEILEGDVTRSMVDGLISVDFSKRIQTLGA
ncbi:hypothetical protein V6N12_074860 [Hibiscus sabdariffa]|uniref:Uncharacterized protein n=1 Tax=Hibiscus sabdariffa TaxID=183260 RepID=A0ABR2D3E2_9ROSI